MTSSTCAVFLSVIVALFAILVSVSDLSSDFYMSYLCANLGLFDRAIAYSQKDNSTLHSRRHTPYFDEDAYMTNLVWMGYLFEIVDKYDEAIELFTDEIIPLYEQQQSRQGMEEKTTTTKTTTTKTTTTIKKEDSLLNTIIMGYVYNNNDVDFAKALDFLASLYRQIGQYQLGLEALARSAGILMKIPGMKEDYSIMKENREHIEEMRELLDVMDRQKQFVTLVVEISQRWHFTGLTNQRNVDSNSRSGGSGSNNDDEDMLVGTTSCAETKESRRKRRQEGDRFYIPSFFVLFVVISTILYVSGRFLWTKRSRIRIILVLSVALPLIGALVAYECWTQESYAERTMFTAMWKSRLCLIVDGWCQESQSGSALHLLDDVRCTILDQPYLESVLTRELVIETFTTALYIYADKEEYYLVDDLTKDINRLIKSHVALGPNISVATYYLFLSDMYLSRGDSRKAQEYNLLASQETRDLADHMMDDVLNQRQGGTKSGNSSKSAKGGEKEEGKQEEGYIDGIRVGPI